MRTLFFIVHPGWITSANDSDRHYISFDQLVDLYRVPRNQCIPACSLDPRLAEEATEVCLVHLWPRYNGNYTIEDRYRGVTHVV